MVWDLWVYGLGFRVHGLGLRFLSSADGGKFAPLGYLNYFDGT